MVGAQCRFGHFRKQEDLLPLPGIEAGFFECPTSRLLALPTELSRAITGYPQHNITVQK